MGGDTEKSGQRTDIELAAAALEAARLADKELFEEKIKHEREQREQRQESYETALKLQAKEYDRRLEALNHEAEQLKKMQATYLPREVGENKIGRLEEDVTVLKLWKSNLMGRLAIAGGIIVLVAGLIGAVLARTFFG
jgi:hypothetical protein